MFLSHRGLSLDPNRRALYFGDQRINLRNREFILMEYFFKNIGRVVTRAELLEEVWDKNIFCTSATIDVHVSNLRMRMKALVPFNDLIRTIYCVGYIVE